MTSMKRRRKPPRRKCSTCGKLIHLRKDGRLRMHKDAPLAGRTCQGSHSLPLRYFITVEWANDGFRGIFAREDGQAAAKDEPWTQEQMDEFLGPFTLILSPKSQPMTAQEIARYTYFFPLAEYLHVWGIAFTRADGEARCEAIRKLAKEASDEAR